LLGRGTVEKAFNMQKAIDAQTRSHLDSLALTTSPMIAMDATRLPRGMKFEISQEKLSSQMAHLARFCIHSSLVKVTQTT